MGDNSTTTPITQKFLDTGDLFGLRFSNGLVFFEVESWEQPKYEPYTGVGSVSSDSTTSFQRLEDGSDDILYIENSQQKVKHVGIGMYPESIRRFTNYPEAENRLRQIDNLSTPSGSDNYGFVDGGDSPYSSPTDAEELLIPPGIHLDFAFHNPDPSPHEVRLNIMMREYNVRPLDPGRPEDANAINLIMNPKSPIPVKPVGSKDNQDRYRLENDWNVTVISGERARNVGGR